VLEGGLSWKDRSYSPKDMILTDLRKFTNDQIRQAFGFPEFSSGILQNANRASSEASAAWYTQRLIVPRLDRIKDVLNYKFLPLFGSTGQNVEFAYSDPVPKDAEAENKERDSKTASFKTLVEAGGDPVWAAMVCGLPEPVMKEVMPTVPAGATG
jgi:phage portal protein BeeE